MMFPEGQIGRIPVAAITGTNGKTTTTRLLGHIVAGSGLNLGMTCTDGIYIGGRRIDNGDCSGPKSARNVLANPSVEAAVLETARGGILREGLGFDKCDVAIVTNIAEGDHLGGDTPEQVARSSASSTSCNRRLCVLKPVIRSRHGRSARQRDLFAMAKPSRNCRARNKTNRPCSSPGSSPLKGSRPGDLARPSAADTAAGSASNRKLLAAGRRGPGHAVRPSVAAIFAADLKHSLADSI
jgi:hypothetical protein